MIISVRGAFGSGKTTIVRALLDKYGGKPLYGALGPRNCEAYSLSVKGVKKPVFILGPYTMPTGGCDQIRPFDKIFGLLKKYATQGHVIFEGAIVSSSFGRVGEACVTTCPEVIFAFLDTPLETCIERVRARRNARKGSAHAEEFDPKNVIVKFKQVEISKRTTTEKGLVKVITISSENGVATLLSLLKEAA